MVDETKIKTTISFSGTSREMWFETVCSNRNIPRSSYPGEIIRIEFGNSINHESLRPFHIVLFSCLVEELKLKGYLISIRCSHELSNFLFSDVNIRAYWGEEHQSHVPSPNIHRLNLWRIDEHYKDFYAISVTQYFKRHFEGKDLSFITTALNELYYNVFDHSKANGNAFSYVYFDKDCGRIHIAVCDFGLGVAKTLRAIYPNFKDDATALQESIKAGVSARTQKHNKGFGLDNICSSLGDNDSFRMISNSALLYQHNGKIKTFNLKNFYFQGTLIYFDFSTDNFEDEEAIEGDWNI